MFEAKTLADTIKTKSNLYNKRSNISAEVIQDKLLAVEKRAVDTWKSMINTSIQNECNELFNIARIKILPYCRIIGEEFIRELGADPYYLKAITFLLNNDSTAPEKEYNYQLAIANLAIGDYFRAYSNLLKAQTLGLDDSLIDNAYLIGLCVFSFKNYPGAIHYFTISQASENKDIRFYSTLFLAVSFRRVGKFKESIDKFDELATQTNYYFTPNDIKFQKAFTMERAKPGDERAINQLTYLAQVGSLGVMKQLIHSKLVLGQVDVISSIYLIDPNNYCDHDLAIYFAYTMLGKGNYASVATLMRINIERSRFDPNFWFLLGYSMVKSANYPQAVIAMQNASILAPTNALFRLAFGSCLELEGRLEEATELYSAKDAALEAEFKRRLVRVGCQERDAIDILSEIVLPSISELVQQPAEAQIDEFLAAPAVLPVTLTPFGEPPEDPVKTAISLFRSEE